MKNLPLLLVLAITNFLFANLSVAQCGPNLIANGSFNGNIGALVTASCWTPTITPDLNDATHPLNTTSGYVWTGTPVPSADGGTWQNIFGPESISQTVNVVPGQPYTLCLQYAAQGITSGLNFSSPVGLNISINGIIVYTTPLDTTQYSWENVCYTFTPTGSTVVINFTPTTNNYLAVDGVSLVQGSASMHPNLGPDTTSCSGQAIQLNGTTTGATGYVWSTGAITPTINVSTPGSYWVQATNGNCTSTDSIQVSFSSLVNLYLGADTTVCSPQTVLLDATTSGATYRWQDSSSSSTYTVTQTGCYSVIVNISNCISVDTIRITVGSLPPASITTPDTLICGNGTTQICATSGLALYSWNTGDSTACLTTSAGGSYYVAVTDNNGCTATSNHIAIANYPAPVVVVSSLNNIFCAGDSTEVCATPGFINYLWSNAKTDSCIQAHHAGNYYVTVTDNNGCTAASNHLPIYVYPLPPVSISVNGDTLTAFNAVTYQWYLNGGVINNATENIYVTNQGGSYTVAITDTNGCSVTSNPVIVLGINPLRPAFSVNVYPNPLENGFWNVDCATDVLGSQIEIYDAGGRLVFESTIIKTQSQIELNAARGIYMLRISSADNSVVKKLIRL